MIEKSLSILLPIAISAMGGLFTELAGVLNIALEGMILTGAFTAIITAELTGSIPLAFLAAICGSVLISLLFAFSALYLRSNIFISGLAINLLVPAVIAMISSAVYGNRGIIRISDGIPPIHPLTTVVIILSLATITHLILHKTPFGTRLRSVGTCPDLIRSRGGSPKRIQTFVIMLSGGACGLAGALISLRLAVFIPGLSASKGWIALVCIYLGNKKPFPILIASFIFALAFTISNGAQGIIEIPATIILSFPYFITTILMVLYSIIKKKKN